MRQPRSVVRAFVVTCIATLTAACTGAVATPSASGPSSLDGVTWRLESGELSGEPILVADGSQPTIEIDGSSVRGRSHCNIFDGSIEVDGDRVAITATQMTEMGCLSDELMDAEAAFLEALSLAESLEVDDAALVLRGPDVILRLAAVPPVRDADLVGTSWLLDSLIDGDAVSSTVGDPATLQLNDDGTLSGSTGCRTLSGRFEAADGQVRVSDLANDDRACDAAVESQDEHVLAVLRDGFTVEIDGDSLTLAAAGGAGLRYLVDRAGAD